MTTTPLRITVWGENVHEQVEQHVAERYPDGMHGAIADGIRENLPDAVVTAALFTFLGAGGDFLIALTLTSTDAVRPITLGIYNYIGSNVTDWGPVMATSVLASLPAAVLLIVAQRYISAGALGGAVK